VSSISFELPGTLNNAVNAAAESTEKSTKTKKSKSTKTTQSKSTKTLATSEQTATSSGSNNSEEPTASSTDSGEDEVMATASASSPADDGETSSKTSAAASEPTGSTGGNSTNSGGSTTASKTFPAAAGESTLSEPMVVTGEFDGGMVRFGRGVSCTGQSEGGNSDAVFQVEEGGTLKNVIIGADQIEGVHCLGACTIENVWWEAVCEDALTLKQTAGTSYVIGGGAKGASDKVFQHNGAGTLNVKGFYASDFGKLYRSCGNCKSGMFERHIIMDGVIADGGSATLVGINTNYGDTATITNSCITNTDPICTEFEGNDTGAEPSEVSTGISASCIYTAADIAAC
jgi:hypothetical protein